MPKSLKVHTGERLDLVDHVLGTNTYTQEMQKFLSAKAIIDRRSRILDGFRVKLEDQTLNPGLITVYNGVAFDRSGQLVNNEDSANDSRSVLLPAGTKNYVEIEFVDVESDTDARYFWDPTSVNTSPIPDGSEFSVNVATRISPDWRIVYPVSTTGFAQTASPDSVRIPIGVFVVDGGGSGIIVGDNPGLAVVAPASVLERDVAIGDTKLYVADARIFPTASFTVTLDLGGTAPETPLTVSSIDRTNNILTLSAPIGGVHTAGAIVVNIATATIVKTNPDPSDPALNPLLATPGHPDPAQRMWQANELRGSGLMQSREAFGARDDQNLSSLKDEIDFLAAQIREMKFGHPRPDTVSQAPPLTFSSRPRYFDRAGSIQGARSNSLSIGNGTTTFGDLNGTTDAVFTAALAALPADGGTIYIKAGTYTFAASVTVSKSVVFVGGGLVTIVNAVVAGPAFIASSSTTTAFNHMLFTTSAFASALDITSSGGLVTFDSCSVLTGLRVNGAVAGHIRASRSTFAPSTAVACVSVLSGGSLTDSSFEDCTFTQAAASIFSCSMSRVSIIRSALSGVSLIASATGTSTFSDIHIAECQLSCTSTLISSSGTQTVLNLRVIDNVITVAALAINSAVFAWDSTVALDTFILQDNHITLTAASSTTYANASAIVSTIANCAVSGITIQNNIVSVPAAAAVILYWSDAVSTTAPVRVVGNTLLKGVELVRLGSLNDYMTSGTYYVQNNVHDNQSSTDYAIGVRLYEEPAPRYVDVSGNTFRNYAKASVGYRIGVDATFDTSSSVDVKISDNLFADWGGAGAIARCIHFSTVATSSLYGSVKVTHNSFTNITCTGGTIAVNIAPDLANQFFDVSVTDNVINLLGTSATLEVTGILLVGVSRGRVQNNSIDSLVAALNGEVYGIKLDTVGNYSSYGVLVSGNQITNIAGFMTELLNGAGIKLIGTCDKVTISDNLVNNSGVLVANPTSSLIVAQSDVLSNIRVSGNTLIGCPFADANGTGIIFIGDGGAFALVMTNLVIEKNTITLSSAGYWTAIRAAVSGTSTNIRVDGNIVVEGVLGDYNTGIHLSGDDAGMARGVVVSNNQLLGVKTGALKTTREGIRVDTCQATSISSNFVDWMTDGVAEGISIGLYNNAVAAVTQCSITNNVITPDGVAAGTAAPNAEIWVGANITYGQIYGNIVCDGTVVGTWYVSGGYGPANWTADASNKQS